MTVALCGLFNFLLHANKIRLIFFMGCLFSFGQLFVGLYWIANAFEFIFINGIFIGFIAILLLTMVLSIFTGISCIAIVYISNLWQLNLFGFSLIFSSFLSLGEFIRGNIFGGFPWNILGYIWAESLVLLQSVSLIGIYGLGLFSFLASTSIILIFSKVKYGIYTLLPILFLFIYGEIRLNFVNDNSNHFIQLRIIQPLIKQSEKWDEKLKSIHLEKLINLSLIDDGKPKPKLILWPESALPYSSSVLENNLKMINWLGEDQVLITGITRANYKNNKLSNIFNSALITDKTFKNKKYYDKIKLVPFGEFNPLKRILNFKKFTDGSIDFSNGTGTNIYELPKSMYNVGILICYEIIFPSKAISGSRPDFLVNITNDAWYGNTYGPLQHLAAARVRAIEEGLPVIRAANTGISAAINQYGEYIDRLELGEEGIIDINLPIDGIKTLFSIYGNFIYVISLSFMLMLAKFTFISKTSKKGNNNEY
jgi:apolipoprotein N-acyltransferase